MLDHELEEVHRAAAATLRNLSYSKARDENKVNRLFVRKKDKVYVKLGKEEFPGFLTVVNLSTN